MDYQVRNFPSPVDRRGKRGPFAFSLSVVAVSLLATSQLCAAANPAELETYPTKPIRMVVPYSPGGGTDILARLIGAKLSESWKQPVVIDNRPGGGTVIGTELVARAPADGHTILIGTGTHTVNATLYPKLPFDPIRDFEPVTLLAVAPNVMVVHPSLPVKTAKEFISFAKARPKQINYASSGNGGTGHLAMEMLKQMARIDVVHVPYKGGGPALNAVLSGEVSALINNMIATVPQIRAGRVRALGVTTGKRSATLPDVPSLAESGLPGFEASGWFGVFVPAGTSAQIVNRLANELGRIMKLPDVEQNLVRQGAEAIGNPPKEFAGFVRSETARWRKVLKAANITAD